MPDFRPPGRRTCRRRAAAAGWPATRGSPALPWYLTLRSLRTRPASSSQRTRPCARDRSRLVVVTMVTFLALSGRGRGPRGRHAGPSTLAWCCCPSPAATLPRMEQPAAAPAAAHRGQPDTSPRTGAHRSDGAAGTYRRPRAVRDRTVTDGTAAERTVTDGQGAGRSRGPPAELVGRPARRHHTVAELAVLAAATLVGVIATTVAGHGPLRGARAGHGVRLQRAGGRRARGAGPDPRRPRSPGRARSGRAAADDRRRGCSGW